MSRSANNLHWYMVAQRVAKINKRYLRALDKIEKICKNHPHTFLHETDIERVVKEAFNDDKD